MATEKESPKGLSLTMQGNVEYRSILNNVDYIFQRLSSDDINNFFKEVCEISLVDEKDKLILLFSALNNALCYMRDEDELIYNFALFKEHTNTPTLIKLYSSRRDFPSQIRQDLLESLKSLTGYTPGVPKVPPEEELQLNLYLQQLVIILENLPVNKLLAVPQITCLLQKVYSPDLYEDNGSSILNIINNIKYNHAMTVEKEKELYNQIHFPTTKNQPLDFINKVVEGLYSQNIDYLFSAIDLYINDYLQVEKNGLRTQLLLDDKIILFYSSYFTEKQDYWNKSFIELILAHYNKEVFFSFMKKYDLPFSIPISFSTKKMAVEEDGDIEEIISYNYISLHNYAIYKSLPLASDLLERGVNVWEDYQYNLVRNNEIPL